MRRLLQSQNQPVTQRELSDAVGMKPDALSRALKNERAFSTIELAEIADYFGADLHYLITGEPDPRQVIVAARHDYAEGTWGNPTRDHDEPVIEGITLAYRQVWDRFSAPSTSSLPTEPSTWRNALGDGFVADFISRLETRLGVDVVRVKELKTSYCLSIGKRRQVIALSATPNWFRENWSLAHELGHLALGHLASEDSAQHLRHEREAMAFAAALLLPEEEVRAEDWQRMTGGRLSDLLWMWGVSTEALKTRLKFLRISPDDSVLDLLEQSTQSVLRRHWHGAGSNSDPITARMEAASARHFPTELCQLHMKAVEDGALSPATLAWMLGVEADSFGPSTIDETLLVPSD